MITTDAEDAVGHIHDRMPLMVERDRWSAWLDPRTGQDDLLDLLVPAAPGRLEAYPVSTLVSNVRNNGPELLEPLPLEEVPMTGDRSPHRHPARRGAAGDRTGPHSPFATLLLSHGAGGGIETADLEALAAAPAAQRDHRRPARAAVAGGRPQGRHAAADPRRRAGRGRAAPARPARRWSSAAAPPAPGRRPGARHGLGAAGCLALAFPLHPPGRPEKSRLHELRGRGVPTLVVQGERDTMGRPEEFPHATVDLAVVPGGRPRPEGARKGAPCRQAEALEIVVESTLEWLVREVAGTEPGRAGE